MLQSIIVDLMVSVHVPVYSVTVEQVNVTALLYDSVRVPPGDSSKFFHSSSAQNSSVIFWFRCGNIDCKDEYIGESSWAFGERFKEHVKVPSPIC